MSFITYPKHLPPVFTASVLILLSFILRLSLISQGPYHVDCLSILIKAQETFETGRLSFALGFGYPVVVLLGAILIGIFNSFGINDPVLAVNFMSVLFASLAVGMLYLIVQRLLDEITAVMSAVLFSASPIFLATSVYGMNHIPAVFFLLTTVYMVLVYLQSGRLRDLVTAGLFLGCMGASRTQDMVLSVPMLTFLLWTQLKGAWGQRLLRSAVYFLTAGIFLVLVHLPFLDGSARAAYSGQIQQYWHLGLIRNFKGIFSPYLKHAVGYNFSFLGFLIAALGFFHLWQKKPRIGAFLLIWFLVPLLFLGNLKMILPRFFIVLIPSIVTAQAYGLMHYYKRGGFWRIGAGVVFFVLVVTQAAVVLPALVYRHNHAVIIDFSLSLKQATRPDVKFLAGDEAAFITHYSQRTVIPKPTCLIECTPKSLSQFRDTLDEAIRTGPVYITDIALLADNPKREFFDFVMDNYDLELMGQYLYEDWHRDCFDFSVWPLSIHQMRIKLREAPIF